MGEPEPKLTVHRQGDRFEQEADRVADRLVRERSPSKELRRHPLSRLEGASVSTAKRRESGGSERLTRRGRPLDAPQRIHFESRLGFDFSRVRVHTGGAAVAMNRRLGAMAFAHGYDLYFNAGRYDPGSAEGTRLLAHELIHVVQQDVPSGHTPRHLQRQVSSSEEKVWLPELDYILPEDVEPPTDTDPTKMLIDIFGTSLLEEHVRRIHADATATKFVKGHGVPGIVALYDTRTGNQLDVAAAKKALATSPNRYAAASLKKLDVSEIARLEKALIATYGLSGVVKGDVYWSGHHLQQVFDAFALLPASDAKALEGVTLIRVASLGGDTAGEFEFQQGVEDTTVTNTATLKLSDSAFADGPPESHLVIVHEVGHALASLAVRTSTHAHHVAIAEENRLLGVSNEAVEESNAAVEEHNRAVGLYNEAVTELNGARRSKDEDRIAKAQSDYAEAKKAVNATKAEADRRRRAWNEAKAKAQAQKKVVAAKKSAAVKPKISPSDLKSIRKEATDAKKAHDARRKTTSEETKKHSSSELAESSDYRVAVEAVSSAIGAFVIETEAQTLSEESVGEEIAAVLETIDARDQAREQLSKTNELNPAISTSSALERAQDTWFAAARAHSLAHTRSARVQAFATFVEDNNVAPVTPYAAEHWPHEPEEFYAEAYSMYLVTPEKLKAKSKALHAWFKSGKYAR